MSITRRDFLHAGCSAALIAGTAPAARVAFAQAGSSNDILVYVFLRGGIDGLSLINPIGGADRGHYEQYRARLAQPLSGPHASLPLNGLFGMHPRAARLRELFQAQRLAIVHAVGLVPTVTRSHFDAMTYLELGTPGSQGIGSGWLTRALDSTSSIPPTAVMPALAAASITPTTLLSSARAITMANGSDFRINTLHWSWDDDEAGISGHVGALTRMQALWQGTTTWDAAGRQAHNALNVVRPIDFGSYQPGNGAVYPDSDFGRQLRMIAQLIKANLGLRFATIDTGGWDTHENQGEPTASYNLFGNLVQNLAEGLHAFYTDLDGAAPNDFMNRITIVVHSEFGRRVRENATRGTDHGYGNPMLLLGNNVRGGQFHGTFPGLAPSQLFEGEDVSVTCDYRRILSEVLIRRLGNNRLGQIFPGYGNYSPLGVVNGPDLPPDYGSGSELMFRNGFEA